MSIQWRFAIRWFSNLLIAFGLLLLFGTAGVYGYAQYEQAQYAREAPYVVPLTPLPTRAPATVTPTLAPVGVVLATPTPGDAEREQARQIAERAVRPPATPTPTPLPTATAVPIYPVERIVAPTIKLDSKVVESRIVNGEWQVPKFVAGHLQGTAEPLEGGNIVLSGHVESISSGNVFANIGYLKPGDPIRLVTRGAVVNYRVTKTVVVPNSDVGVVAAHRTETVTLITCTGTWLPLQRDYNQRLVVIANRVG